MVKKYKKQSPVSYTLGITLTIELLNTKISQVTRVFVHSKINITDSFKYIESKCRENNIPLIYSNKPFNILSRKGNCFIIGEFKKSDSKLTKTANHVVLVNPSNAGNLGTIIRSMVGFNINNLAIIEPAVDIYDPNCIRASMGSIFHLNFEVFTDFKDYYKKYNNRNYYPFMLEAKENISRTELNGQFSLIFGNEATGLNSDFLNYGTPVIIQHSNNIDSLNLPIAVSIGLFHATKNNF